MRAFFTALFAAILLAGTAAATPIDRTPDPIAGGVTDRIVARVSISRQVMQVYHENRLLFEWPVSTARQGKVTPTGQWKPQFLSKNHKSSRYNGAPMPYSIFYSGNYAIHGTNQTKKLGRPASAGCVRLNTANAKILFNMVRAEGKENMRVVVVQ